MSFDLALVNKDLKIQSDGSIKTITDTPKLRQEVLKIILTPLGSVRYHPWYGCSIDTEAIGNPADFDLIRAQIVSSITSSLEKLRTLQRSQSANQRVSLAEIIESIAHVSAERDVNDARGINVVVTVISKRLTKVDELFTIIS